MAHGEFYWNELLTNDVEKAKAFFSAVVGWRFDAMPMPEGGTYWVAMADGKAAGGIMSMAGFAPPGTPPHWIGYLAVDDIDKRLASAVTAGAEVLRPAFDIPGVGRIAILRDPTGAAMGWITPAPSAA